MPTTQETSYRRLQREIVRMFPELGKLTFGCDLQWQAQTPEFTGVYQVVYSKNGLVYTKRPSGGEDYAKFEIKQLSKNNIEILGLPLQLAHVLRALNHNTTDEHYWQIDREERTGNWMFNLCDCSNYCQHIEPVYFPLHLPVSEYPPETLQKILDLISG